MLSPADSALSPVLQSALLDLYHQALSADEPGLYSAAVEAAVSLSSSTIAYLHLVNEDQESIELGTWSAGTLRQCQAVYDRHYPLSAAGVWADCARERQPCIHNDYPALVNKRGYPEGHVPLVRHLGVPVIDGGKVVLLLGVGNKAEPYDGVDLSNVQALADHAWALIQRHRRQVELERSARQLQDLQEMAAICVWQWDPEERRLHCDGNARRIFAIDPLSDIACSVEGLLRFIDTRDHPAVLDVLRSPTADSAFDLELRGVRGDGSPLTVHFRGAAYPRTQGHGLVLRGILQDISERKELGRVRYQASHDALTGLVNRAQVMQELERHLRLVRRKPDDQFAILFIDLDRFKPINDCYGHQVGDQVLRLVAERLLSATRKDDLVARIGGDELLVIQQRAQDAPAALALAGKIISALEQPMPLAGQALRVSASVGIALSNHPGEGAEALVARADRAMYQAKQAGGGQARLG